MTCFVLAQLLVYQNSSLRFSWSHKFLFYYSAFILPGLFSFRLQGYKHLAAFILAVGGVVGLVGTAFSLQKLISDI